MKSWPSGAHNPRPELFTFFIAILLVILCIFSGIYSISLKLIKMQVNKKYAAFEGFLFILLGLAIGASWDLFVHPWFTMLLSKLV